MDLNCDSLSVKYRFFNTARQNFLDEVSEVTPDFIILEKCQEIYNITNNSRR